METYSFCKGKVRDEFLVVLNEVFHILFKIVSAPMKLVPQSEYKLEGGPRRETKLVRAAINASAVRSLTNSRGIALIYILLEIQMYIFVW